MFRFRLSRILRRPLFSLSHAAGFLDLGPSSSARSERSDGSFPSEGLPPVSPSFGILASKGTESLVSRDHTLPLRLGRYAETAEEPTPVCAHSTTSQSCFEIRSHSSTTGSGLNSYSTGDLSAHLPRT